MRASQEVSQNGLPFILAMGEALGHAMYSHNKVRGLGDEWVAKTLRPQFRKGDWRGKLVDDYHILQTYLRSFVPATYFVEGRSEQNVRDFL